MVNRRFFIILAVPVLLLPRIAAGESFEGLATVGSGGRFPTGLYGATNLVPPNTLVTVRNLETGAAERIIITNGVRERGIFLVLSPEAAASLGFDASGMTRVRLSEVRRSGVAGDDTAPERPRSPDPDLNPLAVARSLIDTLPPAHYPDGDPAVLPAVLPAEKPDELVLPQRTDEEAARTGVAAGIAHTRVGDEKADLERPDPPLPVSRRAAVERDLEPTDLAELPEVGAEEPAAASLEMTAHPPDEAFHAPLAEARPAIDERPDPGAPEPIIADGPVDLAVRSVVNRLPRKDVHPSPAVADGEIGLRTVSRPADEALVVELPAARPPSVERPALAGLAPLRIVESDPEVVLAQAVPPREHRPEGSLAARQAESVPVTEVAVEPRIAETEEADGSFDRTRAVPAEVPRDALLALEPADFRPPQAAMPDRESRLDESERVAVREPEPARVAVVDEEEPAVDRIESDSYYLQIGAYANAQTARVAVDALGVTYPMAVVPIEREEQRVYRVLVGPLERDETGTLLLWLRQRGYRDTFIRTGGEL